MFDMSIVKRAPSVESKFFRGEATFYWLLLRSSFIQFSDHDFASLSGGRIVRIATHPDFQRVSNVLFSSISLSYSDCWKAEGCLPTSVNLLWKYLLVLLE